MIDEMIDSGAFWQMSMAEKAAVQFLIAKMPMREVAIEVGTYCGGFLRVLDRKFPLVYSIDLTHASVRKGDFKNTDWFTGDSRQLLPSLIEQIELEGSTVNLVLIDADHSYDAVLHDINAVLQYRPKGQLLLLMHDSWMGPVRQAIDDAAWNDCPYVHEVETDFCTGDLAPSRLVGGLALAVLTPEVRTGDLLIRKSHDHLYRNCLKALRS